jgi:hemoglobin/transferrin/lactoferrin receptor protein
MDRSTMARSLLCLVLIFISSVVEGHTRESRRATIAGRVQDLTGAVIQGARITLRMAQNPPLSSVMSDDQGHFVFRDIPYGSYELEVTAEGFAGQKILLRVIEPKVYHLTVTVQPSRLREEVTVTAEPALVSEPRQAIQAVSVILEQEIALRAKSVLAQSVQQEAGLHLQRTSPTLGGVFVRGLTGNKVNVYVDGVRYSTAAARGGINTFLNLISPSHLDVVEVLRGPRSTDMGSDAIGGSVQLMTRRPALSERPQWHGEWAATVNTADAGYGSHLRTTLGTSSVGLLASFVGSRANTLRPGRGVDSHSALTRFLGLRSNLIHGPRLPDTAFTQYGGLVSLTWSPAPTHSFSFHYQRGQQDGGKRYDQLLGGDGNLIADLRNLILDFFYARYDKHAWGWVDLLTIRYSHNAQREERVTQGGSGNPRATIVHEYEKTRARGITAVADKVGRSSSLRLGAEYYHEGIRAPAYGLDPVNQTITPRRPRVPDRARYRSGAAYIQGSTVVSGQRVRIVGGLRYSAASYRSRASDAPLINGRPLWPDDSLRVDDVSGRAGTLIQMTSSLGMSFHFSRGFRAPHITDLGTLGLTGSGFEVAAPEAASLGGIVGSTADRNAQPTGQPVRRVRPETSNSFDVALRLSRDRVRAEISVFFNDLSHAITKQALILPPGAVGKTLGGERIIAQEPNGVVFVALSSSPVLVRANFGDVRIWGVEHTFDVSLMRHLLFGGVVTSIRAKEKQTGAPPNIEGGTPAPDGWLRLRYTGAGRMWIEPYLYVAARQSRLSTLSLEDRRTGGLRSRASIAAFFRNGAMARGLIGPGADGLLGTADDVLRLTGETLSQVQDRVLGVGVTEAPLFPAIPGYITVNLRGGVQLSERQDLLFDWENITDRNYRGISWGLDGPGRSLFVRYRITF